jgi:hypothetical protein
VSEPVPEWAQARVQAWVPVTGQELVLGSVLGSVQGSAKGPVSVRVREWGKARGWALV